MLKSRLVAPLSKNSSLFDEKQSAIALSPVEPRIPPTRLPLFTEQIGSPRGYPYAVWGEELSAETKRE